MNNTTINKNIIDNNLYLLQQEINANIKIDSLLKRRSRKGGFVSWPEKQISNHGQNAATNKRN